MSSLALLVNCTIDYNASESHVARRGVGNGNVHVDYRWPNQTVHYYFDDSWSPSNLKIADRSVKVATAELAAMVMKHGGVNLSFVDVTIASRAHGYDGAHLKITNLQKNCAATVGHRGKQNGYADHENKMYLRAPWCFGSEATVKHEFGHVLGLWHEHQHPFSSRYITKGCEADDTCKNDINCERQGRFSVTTTPYDFLSIMHYSLGQCGGMTPTEHVGKALLKAQGISQPEYHVGGVQNFSVHDAQMIAAEYSDGLLMDTKAKESCENGEIQKCDTGKCVGVSNLGNDVCDESLRCYYLDGGDCDDTFSPFGLTDHTVVYVKGDEHVCTDNEYDYRIAALVMVLIVLGLLALILYLVCQ